MKKAIYILQEDPRETDTIKFYDGRKTMQCIDGIICYSLEDACTKLLKRMWYITPNDRAMILDARRKFGAIKAFKKCASYWSYCPYYLKRYIDTDKF